MPSLKKKIIKGHIYWYAVEMARINGKPKQVWQMYLGTAEKIIEVMKGSEDKPYARFKSFQYGKIAAMLQISETFMTGLRHGFLDTCVTACDGAGTVITCNPKLAQGMGSRISGLVETTPIPKLIERIQEVGGIVLDPENATLDQVAGVENAIKLGYKKIGVSVTNAKDVRAIRELEKKHKVHVIAFGVHTTGMSQSEANEFIDLVDMTTGCTSKWIRGCIAGKTIAQFGTAIPVFAITQCGKEMLLERAKEVTDPIIINTMKLPVQPDEKQPRPLI